MTGGGDSDEYLFEEGQAEFFILLECGRVELYTPFRKVSIEERLSEGESLEKKSPHLPILAIGEALINRLNATLDFMTFGKEYSCELSMTNFSGRQMRKVGERDVKLVVIPIAKNKFIN